MAEKKTKKRIVGEGWEDLYDLTMELFAKCKATPLVMIKYAGKPLCEGERCEVRLRCYDFEERREHRVPGVTGTVIITKEQWEYLWTAYCNDIPLAIAIFAVGREWKGLRYALDLLSNELIPHLDEWRRRFEEYIRRLRGE